MAKFSFKSPVKNVILSILFDVLRLLQDLPKTSHFIAHEHVDRGFLLCLASLHASNLSIKQQYFSRDHEHVFLYTAESFRLTGG